MLSHMGEPRVVPRSEHSISRSLIDPEALKVLYRLHQSQYTAYLVGGGVRDLLLGRKPKDFDIGTSAHPHEVKKLFRNCWIIGRRFRLAHVRFGAKTVEVATFRRLVTAEELAAASETAAPDASTTQSASAPAARTGVGEHIVHRDNTFGTPEEDAFRRDFTINALFYDIGTFSVIDYTGGLEDLRAGLIRSIGDPLVRFREDPVRMMRAVAFAARLGFTLDPPVAHAIAERRTDIAHSAPARLMEEFFKLLRSGSSEGAFRMMAQLRLLEPISPELQRSAGPALWTSLAALDAYRNRFDSVPDTMSNAVLLGSLIAPLSSATRVLSPPPERDGEFRKEPVLSLGMLPLARRDVERLRQIMGLQRRLTEATISPRARRGLVHRGSFREALTWLDVHGRAPEALDQWRGFLEAAASVDAAGSDVGPGGPADADSPEAAPRPRRRRRRGRRRPPPPPVPS